MTDSAKNSTCYLMPEETEKLLAWVESVNVKAAGDFERAQQIVSRLGAHYRNGSTEIGIYAPEIAAQNIPDGDWHLEVLTPLDAIDLTADEQKVRFQRSHVPLKLIDDCAWGVIAGMTPGTRDHVGCFYWLRYKDAGGNWHSIHDHLAYSVPFGTLAPAELYDIETMQASRADATHFSNMDWDADPMHQNDDGIPRVGPPVNILQIHPGTASPEGTLEGLRQIYARIAEKRRSGEALTPEEQNYIGYDAVQLLPVEPPIEHEAGPAFWNEEPAPKSDTLTATLHQHDIFDWGYDVMVSASPAVNPAITSTKRPDELVDLIAELHNFPDGPIKVIFDIVYGHTDNQALKLFHTNYLAGANMYGQNLNYRHLIARATWLEMQRRKSDYGVDGIRVDGAQDFKGYDPVTNTLYHDDEYLRQMND
ncbi:MAG: glucosylglycerol hydrolase, partial [Chloroflexota bacterium]